MKRRFLSLAILASLALVAAASPDNLVWRPVIEAATPAATPGPLVVIAPAQSFQSTATAWISAIVAVLGVVTTALLPAVAVLWTRLRDVIARQDRQSEKTAALQQGQTAIALATPAPVTPPATPATQP